MTIHYRVSTPDRHRQFIHFEADIPTSEQHSVLLQLPSWRPGRYELGNFAGNLRAVRAEDPTGKPLPVRKLTKDLWEVETAGCSVIKWSYQYYASELNAGSTWLDDNQLYINPVNCFFYLPDKPEAAFELGFELPADYRIATGMETRGNHKLFAINFHRLFDCPLIAAADLKHLSYEMGSTTFHIWAKGDAVIDEEKWIADFRKFTRAQLEAFGQFPVSEYHFLFQFPAFNVRHGVEHENSTVIAIGPAELVSTERWYDELIGISSHELYHTWNVKSLRAVDMVPYDFTRENYSRLGYVTEGVTTYMGDLMLWRSGFFNDTAYFEILRETIQKHLDNPGRFNLSLADSSFDTWLDGYKPGIPWRKVSIYNEGCLAAMMTDLLIQRSSDGAFSLDTVMRELWEKFGKKGIGFTENDYRTAIARAAGSYLPEIFDLIYGTSDYLPLLDELLNELGIEMQIEDSKLAWEGLWGITLEANRVSGIYPDSAADKAGLWIGDLIVALNGRTSEVGIDKLITALADSPVLLTIKRHGRLRELTVLNDVHTGRKTVSLKTQENLSANLNLWRSGIK